MTLDPEQRAAVLAPGPVVVLAGPGTGKTRTITHRIAHRVRDGQNRPQRVLAVTFTRRAAGEMRARLAELEVQGVSVRTFHSAALRQLTHFWPQLVGGQMPVVLPAPAEAVAAVLAEIGWDAEPRDVLAEIDWAKATLTTPEAYVTAGRRRDAVRIAEAYEAYERFKVRHGRIDLHDVVLLLAAGLADDPGVARQVRDSYRHLVVDEYQDVSPAQQALLDAWRGDSDDLFVVGDPDQTIYGFAGATAAPLLDLGRRLPGATVVRLTRCYRCAPEVVAAARRISDSPLRSVRPTGGTVTLESHADAAAERRAVVLACRRALAAGIPPQEVAVLTRTRAQAQTYADALATADVPALLRDERAYFDRREIGSAVALLRLAARLPAEAPPAVQVVDVLSGLGWSPDGGRHLHGAALAHWLMLRALVDAAEGRATMADVVAYLDRCAEDGIEPPVRAVTVTTMHAAKGREWDAVFVAGLAEGLTPRQAEERRLLYVAVTRARTTLGVSWVG